jgi:hypothetical protein
MLVFQKSGKEKDPKALLRYLSDDSSTPASWSWVPEMSKNS